MAYKQQQGKKCSEHAHLYKAFQTDNRAYKDSKGVAVNSGVQNMEWLSKQGVALSGLAYIYAP